MAMMQQFMNMDDGGRRVENIGLRGSNANPEQEAFLSMGSHNYQESLARHTAEEHGADDKRRERDKHGHIPFRLEHRVPDVGGIGWRTKSGQMIKNQNFYSQQTKVNKWDEPTFAGVNTWKEWHGPKMRADANTMERLDKFDAEAAGWEAKRTFVNTARAETLDRFYNQKLNRTQKEVASSWAPQRHPLREVHSIFETFDSTLDERPVKEVKKVLTPFVLHRDREAMRQIASRLQNEETWKKVFLDIEQERRADIRADFQLRQAHNDRLMLLSGQPVMERDPEEQLQPVFSTSVRGDELSRPVKKPLPEDVSRVTDFRGLYHADNEHALEALFPGSGHELSVEFRKEISRSSKPGWPRPQRAQTPTYGERNGRREAKARQEEVAKASIPSSPNRLRNVCSRRDDAMMAGHAKAQFLDSMAPPPLDQSSTLLGEDWSPKTTLLKGGGSRVTGGFSRTSHVNGSKSMGELPPPKRRMAYPVLSPTSPERRGPLDVSHMSSIARPSGRLSHNASAPSFGVSRQSRATRASSQSTAELCAELDSWEAKTQKVPGINNFFGTPQATRHSTDHSQ
jgi:hypothetical protein